MAQEAEQALAAGEGARGGGDGGTLPASAASLQRQALEHAAASQTIDPDLIDAYMDMPRLTTIHDMLLMNDPRHDRYGIWEGIEHGGYRAALEELLPNPPPRDRFGGLLPDNRARMLERLGRYEEAERLYRDHAADSEGHVPSQLAMARVLEHLGRSEESAGMLARACRLDRHAGRAFEAGMRPDPRQLDPAAAPLRLIVPMSVISAAGTMRSRAELSAASFLVQAECGLDLYPRSGERLPGCAGLGADMEKFHHLVVEDVLSYYIDTCERPYYYDLADRGIEMIGLLGERLGGSGNAPPASPRLRAASPRSARMRSWKRPAPHGLPRGRRRQRRPGGGGDRAAGLEALRGTAGRILREIGCGIAFGEAHSLPMEDKARLVPDMLSGALCAPAEQWPVAPAEQWPVAAALAGDVLGLCGTAAFDQRPHPRTSALGPPVPRHPGSLRAARGVLQGEKHSRRRCDRDEERGNDCKGGRRDGPRHDQGGVRAVIFADANVIPAHLVFFAVRGRDGRQTVRVQRHSRGRAAAMLDAATGSGDPAAAGTAADEARRNARRAVLSAARDAGATDRRASEAAGKVRAEIGRLHSRFGVRDRKACAEKARGAHARAWADGRMRGAIAVRRIIKEGHRKDASMPTPEKNKGDFVILSTAAYWAARGHKARLPAFDRDLAAFSIAIRERLGVDVVDCGRLGRQQQQQQQQQRRLQSGRAAGRGGDNDAVRERGRADAGTRDPRAAAPRRRRSPVGASRHRHCRPAAAEGGGGRTAGASLRPSLPPSPRPPPPSSRRLPDPVRDGDR